MSFFIKTIDHILLAAPNGCEQRAREFYANILGLHEIEKPEGLKKRRGVWFSSGNVEIHIGVEEPFSPAKKAYPAFQVENLHDLKLHLQA